MKRVILDNIVFSLQRAGGISVVWENIIKALQDSRMYYECYEYPGHELNIFRQKMNSFNVVEKKPLSMFLERYSNLKINNKEPFIFHSSYYRICSNSNAINVTTVHDFTYEKFGHGMSAFVHKMQKFYAIRHSDYIVCISKNTKDDLLKFMPDINPNKIRIIYNGVSNDYYPINTNRWDELGEYVVFVGSRQSYKNFRFTVEAIKDTIYNLVIVGSSLNDEEIYFLNKTLGDKRYKCVGYLSNKELNELYNQAYCLAYPSIYEGFGIPVIEAQKAGCPVIAYNASSIPEIIGPTPLLLNKYSIEDFHSKLNLLKNISIRKNIVKSGLENSRKFSWVKMGQQYVNLYNEIINSNRL